ncbi:Coiled-coil domain-containing protein 106 [Collichthys lucidus]|uniref:Coiled-coil domain-containing protein 106 n=1 Tax=Collichthys lucidus TaxID=240159 RepID=A0A4U5ULR7_COLLU|nr:Coiled-coil domain-containing protein 106 [Collichthys lucidus]
MVDSHVIVTFILKITPKAKKKTHVQKEEVMTDVPEMTEHKPNSTGSVSMVEFSEAKIQWQDKLIKDLEEERNFLRAQVQGERKKTLKHPKVLKMAVDYEDDGHMDDGDDLSPSSPNISDSSDSDTPRRKPHPTQSPPVKGPDEAIRRYQRVLKTFSRVRTMSEAFRINGVDRGTIKMTAPIAELKIVDPDTFNTLKFNPATDTLMSFAKKCAAHISSEKRVIIEDMKSRGKLLPLLLKY